MWLLGEALERIIGPFRIEQTILACFTNSQCFWSFGQNQQMFASHAQESENDMLLRLQLSTSPTSIFVVRCGGAISWHTCRAVSLRPRATVGERFDFEMK